MNAANSWNPWLGIWTTLTRKTREGAAIQPDEALTREQAIRLYTYNNAWLYLEDKEKGSPEPGKLADLIVVDTDVLKCPVDEIRDTRVLLTMVDGKVVWEAKTAVLPGPELMVLRGDHVELQQPGRLRNCQEQRTGLSRGRSGYAHDCLGCQPHEFQQCSGGCLDE